MNVMVPWPRGWRWRRSVLGDGWERVVEGRVRRVESRARVRIGNRIFLIYCGGGMG